MGDESPSQDPWTILPSQLHLEVLQLLQEATATGQDDDGSYTQGGEGVRLQELYEALAEVNALNYISKLYFE